MGKSKTVHSSAKVTLVDGRTATLVDSIDGLVMDAPVPARALWACRLWHVAAIIVLAWALLGAQSITIFFAGLLIGIAGMFVARLWLWNARRLRRYRVRLETDGRQVTLEDERGHLLRGAMTATGAQWAFAATHQHADKWGTKYSPENYPRWWNS